MPDWCFLAVIGALVVYVRRVYWVAVSMVSRRLEREESGIASSCLQQLLVGSLLHQFPCPKPTVSAIQYSRTVGNQKAIWFWVKRASVLEDPPQPLRPWLLSVRLHQDICQFA